MKGKKKILVAPLNWGLGHTTRCIPIIDELLKQGHELVLASDGAAAQLLKAEYPTLPFVELPSYQIYNRSPNFFINFLPQIPTILKAIKREQRAVKKIIKMHKISVVISDNRYGVFGASAKNIFITHQLKIQTPFRWSTYVANLFFPRFYKPFQEIWVPDFASAKKNLSGSLGHGKRDARIHYINPLSRFSSKIKTQNKPRFLAAAILSGPEPQRSRFEAKLVSIFKDSPFRFLLVRGKTEGPALAEIPSNIKVYPFLKRNELFEVISDAEIIISRSGYSTLMDLSFLEKKVVLVPTPGQTEQEYLGVLAKENWNCEVISQKKLEDLRSILQDSNHKIRKSHFPKGESNQKLKERVNRL